MDIMSAGGMIFAIGMLISAFLLEGGSFGKLLQPTAAMIVLGGTIGATLTSFPLKDIKKIGKALKTVFFNKPIDQLGIIDRLAELGDKARRSGILSLEEEIPKQDNELIKKGLELIMSGLDKDLVAETLMRQSEIDEADLHSCAAVWEAAGGYSPTMGIVGTVMGLVSVLGGLATAGMEKLGESISVAFIATLYGIFFANIFYIPWATKIKTCAKKQKAADELVIEGILSIQAGENPKVMKDKLSYELIAKLSGVNLEAKEAAAKAAKAAAKE
ncbi:MAG: MotA/TolQ/ExbB proton channel family protein [Clostridia bacterium]|nr:MotA/TolQ/ExbB proton channel family protein [Clostridia bacterium]